MRQINVAYGVLGNDQKRKQYDRKIGVNATVVENPAEVVQAAGPPIKNVVIPADINEIRSARRRVMTQFPISFIAQRKYEREGWRMDSRGALYQALRRASGSKLDGRDEAATLSSDPQGHSDFLFEVDADPSFFFDHSYRRFKAREITTVTTVFWESYENVYGRYFGHASPYEAQRTLVLYLSDLNEEQLIRALSLLLHMKPSERAEWYTNLFTPFLIVVAQNSETLPTLSKKVLSKVAHYGDIFEDSAQQIRGLIQSDVDVQTSAKIEAFIGQIESRVSSSRQGFSPIQFCTSWLRSLP